MLFSGLTKELEEVIKKDEFVLSLKHLKARKRNRGSVETLFSVDFPGAEHKFILQLDRKTKRGKFNYINLTEIYFKNTSLLLQWLLKRWRTAGKDLSTSQWTR